jgi:hypothetical protein
MLFHCLLSGSLPVYLGAPEAGDFVPGGKASFVSVLDFKDEEALLNHLVWLNENPAEYSKYFEWRSKPFSEVFKNMFRKSLILDCCRFVPNMGL